MEDGKKGYQNHEIAKNIKNTLEKIKHSFEPPNLNLSAPKLTELPPDPKLELLYSLNQRVENIENNSKEPAWKTILIGVASGLIGGILVLIVEHFVF